MTDWELLQQYVSSASQEAFAELVRRHLGWVRASAMRQVRDAHLADDVAQAVFLALARQAHRLNERAALSTWLFQVTRYAAANALRAESRRRRHERQAAMESQHDDAMMSPQQWERLSPVLDALVARLRRDDRRAVLLRFYEQKSYPEMAAALGVSEDAARKRTDRAVEKLRQLIGTRELTLSAGALSAGLLAHAAGPASPALASAATEAGSRGADASAPVADIAKGAVLMMNLTRLRLPLAASAALLLVAVVGAALLSAAPEPAAATQSVMPAATQPAAAAAAAPEADSAKAVVFAAFRAAAAGDADGLIGRFDRLTPAQAETLRQVAQIMSAARGLSDAVRERFGADVERPFSRAIGVGVAEFDVTSAIETIHGDTATVDIGAGPGEVPLVRSGQTWKISPRVLQTLNPNAVRQFTATVPAIEKLTADVRAGKYKTIEELHKAVGTLVRPTRNRPATAAATSPGGGGGAPAPPR